MAPPVHRILVPSRGSVYGIPNASGIVRPIQWAGAGGSSSIAVSLPRAPVLGNFILAAGGSISSVGMSCSGAVARWCLIATSAAGTGSNSAISLYIGQVVDPTQRTVTMAQSYIRQVVIVELSGLYGLFRFNYGATGGAASVSTGALQTPPFGIEVLAANSRATLYRPALFQQLAYQASNGSVGIYYRQRREANVVTRTVYGSGNGIAAINAHII